LAIGARFISKDSSRPDAQPVRQQLGGALKRAVDVLREGGFVDDEVAVACIEMEGGGGVDFVAPIGGLAVGEMPVAAGGGLAAGGEAALDLGRGPELVMAHGDAAGGGDAHVGRP